MKKEIQHAIYRDLYTELRPSVTIRVIKNGAEALANLDGGDLRRTVTKKDLKGIDTRFPFVKSFILGIIKPRYRLARAFGVTYAHYKIIFDGLPSCLTCGKRLLRLVTTKRIIKFCSPGCGQLHDTVQETRKLKTIEKYGYAHTAKVPTVREKFVNTCLVKYGFVNPMMAEKVQEKSVATNMSRYGVPYAGTAPEAVKKRLATMQGRYGVNYSFESKELLKKYGDTMEERYGCRAGAHSPDIRAKQNRHQTKTLVYEGAEYQYQGYENYLIEHLLKKGYSIASSIKGIPYERGARRYFADVAAISPKGQRYLFEVKSSYTFRYGVEDGTLAKKTKAARLKCKKFGVRFIVVIVNPKPLKFSVAKRYSS